MRDNLQVFIIPGKDPLKNLGGYSSYAYNLAKALSQEISPGKLHLVCVSEENQTQIKETDFCQVHYVKSFFKSLETPLLPLHSFFLAKHIKNYISQQNINEKVFIFALGSWSLVGRYLKSKWPQKDNPVVSIGAYFTTHEHEGRKLWQGITLSDYGWPMKIKYTLIYYIFIKGLSLFERKAIKGLDFVLVHYQSTKDILKEEFNLLDNRFIFSPYYSVEVVEKEDMVKPESDMDSHIKRPMVLTVCRQEARKGINYLLWAIKEVVKDYKKNANFVFIGSGDLLKAHIRLAKKLDIQDSVQFLGFVKNIEPFLENGDMFILPSIEEGSSAISLQEAMKYQLPIITTDCDGMPEDITDGISGLLVPPANSHQLAQAIIRLLNDKELAQKIAKNAEEIYQRKFTSRKMKITIETIFKVL